MESEIKSYCREKGIGSESEFIRAAIVSYIAGEIKDNDFILSEVMKINSRLQHIEDVLTAMHQYNRFTHIDLLMYNAEIDDAMKEAANKSAVLRHKKVEDAYHESLYRAPAVLERALHRMFTEDKETGKKDGPGRG
jgi:hypothetical protein